MDSERVLQQIAEDCGLVVLDQEGNPSDNDIFHHFVGAGCVTAGAVLTLHGTFRARQHFIEGIVGPENMSSDAARKMRKFYSKVSAVVKSHRKFEKTIVARPQLSRGHTGDLANLKKRDAVPQAHTATTSKHMPADRRSLRTKLMRARTEILDEVSRTAVSSTAPALVWHVRRAAGRLFLRAAAMQQPLDKALPAVEPSALAWLGIAVPARPGCAENTLRELEKQLLELHDVVLRSSERDDYMIEQLQSARQVLATQNPTFLARAARQLHARATKLCTQISALLLGPEGSEKADHARDVACKTAESQTPMPVIGQCSEEMEQQKKWARTVELSQEQCEAVECPRSIFLQGRSGTGKTLVLVRRMLHRLRESAGAQVFITKSSMLCDDVTRQLRSAGCEVQEPSWPPRTVQCLTWTQFVQLMLHQNVDNAIGPKIPAHGAAVDYARFLAQYWPRLRPKARQLPPLLIWAEFNNRLRSFQSVWGECLDLKDYLADSLAAVGIRLDNDDLRTVHGLFKMYRGLKKSARELDDTDVAMLMRARAPHACIGQLYVDEAQDFSPTELALLMSLCRDGNGVTVAGDTCQTINPGSAFNFREIADAFIEFGGVGMSEQELIEDFKEQARECRLLHLRCNYRSPASIAALAASVSRLLLDRFPNCADRLDETSLQSAGKLPVFIELPGIRPASCIMGEGAHRLVGLHPARVAILVRSDEARQRLRSGGVSGTILTVPEAKGLEFDFVILCGLLTDCPDSTLWSLADDKSMETKAASFAASVQELLCKGDQALRLSPQEHRLLCRVVLAIPELKSLYVAITRARAGCVLLECKHDPGVWAPLLSRWEAKQVIDRWCSVRTYMLEAAEASTSEELPSALMASAEGNMNATDVSSVHEGSATYSPMKLEEIKADPPKSHGEMLTWLKAEIAACEGRAQKQVRESLQKERRRLQKGGALDLEFFARFKESCGPRQHHEQQRKDSNEVSDSTALPSLVPMLERRFGSERSGGEAAPPSLELLGSQMLNHAADDPRERWRVFAEARRALLEARKGKDAQFLQQIRSFYRRSSMEGSSLDPEACAIRIQAFIRGARARSRTQGRLRSARGSLSILRNRQRAAAQICTVLQEALRPRSWRGGSTLANLQRVVLWVKVFEFIWPHCEVDVHNIVTVVAEQVREHSISQFHVVRGIVLAHGWYMLSRARFDLRARMREDTLQQSVTGMLRGRQLTQPIFAEMASQMMEMSRLSVQRAKLCADAGAAFVALREWRHAAESFAEAAAITRAMPVMARGPKQSSWGNSWSELQSVVVAAERQSKEYAIRAANLWLLLVRQVGCTGHPGDEALQHAAELFDSVGLACEAACCVARAGHLRVALRYLHGAEGSAPVALGLLFAALIGELGVTHAPV